MNKTAIVTGASRGIGHAVALALLDKGYDVAVTSRHIYAPVLSDAEGDSELDVKASADSSSELDVKVSADSGSELDATVSADSGAELESACYNSGISEPANDCYNSGISELANAAKARGHNFYAFEGDVGSYESMKQMIDKLGEAFMNNLEVLVNNAGIAHIGLFTDMKPDEIEALLRTDLLGTMNMCHLVVPFMVKRKSGHIINVSSMWGQVGASCEAVYSAAKGGVDAFTKALAKELAPSNIAVNAVSPGVVDTEMNRSHLSSEDMEVLVEEIPANRLAEPSEIGAVIAGLTEMTPYLTGQIIRVDGGMV